MPPIGLTPNKIELSSSEGETTKSVKAAEATAPAAGTVPAVAAAQPAESAKVKTRANYRVVVVERSMQNPLHFTLSSSLFENTCRCASAVGVTFQWYPIGSKASTKSINQAYIFNLQPDFFSGQ